MSFSIKIAQLSGIDMCEYISMAKDFTSLKKSKDLASVARIIPGLRPAVQQVTNYATLIRSRDLAFVASFVPGLAPAVKQIKDFAALIQERDLEDVVKFIPGIGDDTAILASVRKRSRYTKRIPLRRGNKKDLVGDAKDLIETAPDLLTDIKSIATSMTDIPGKLENVAEMVFSSMFPMNPSLLMNVINGEFRNLVASASAEASLGRNVPAAQPLTRNFLFDDERAIRSVVRAKISAALRDEEPAAHAAEYQMPPAALGEMTLGDICFNAPDVNLFIDMPDASLDFESFDASLDFLEHKPLKPLAYAMPWPDKLVNDPSRPAEVKLPLMKTNTCIKLSFDAGLVNMQVAKDLVKVFLDFFKPIIFAGLQAVMNETLGDGKRILNDVDPIITLVGGVKKDFEAVVQKNIFPTFKQNGRKLLVGENADDAHRWTDTLRNEVEERLLRKSMELRRALIADPFMENNFMDTHLPGVDVGRPIAGLGGAFKDVIIKTAQGSFDRALQGMKDTEFTVSFTQKFELDILIKLTHGKFQTGDLIPLVMNPKPVPAFEFEKAIPIAPPLMGKLEIAGDFELP